MKKRNIGAGKNVGAVNFLRVRTLCKARELDGGGHTPSRVLDTFQRQLRVNVEPTCRQRYTKTKSAEDEVSLDLFFIKGSVMSEVTGDERGWGAGICIDYYEFIALVKKKTRFMIENVLAAKNLPFLMIGIL